MEEPMEIDSSHFMPPSTPARSNSNLGAHDDLIKPRPDSLALQDDLMNSQKKPTNNTATLNPSGTPGKINKPSAGAKIVKPIRPVGPRVIKPVITPNYTDFNDDEFANIDPFKSKPKIGFDASAPINNHQQTKEVDADELSNLDDPFKTGLNRSPSSTNRNSLPTEEDFNLNGSNSITTDDDEWERHVKRTSSSSSSNRKSSLINQKSQEENCHPNQQQQQQQQHNSPQNNKASSIVSSTTDLSSVTSSSPPSQHLIPSSSSSNTTSTSSISNKTVDLAQGPTDSDNQNNNCECGEKVSDNDPFRTPKASNTTRLSNEDLNSLNATSNLHMNSLIDVSDPNIPISQMNAVENVVFDSIFSNDNEFQSFLDLLEKKETSTRFKSPKFSEFARKSLYLQFDPIAQLKSLSPDKVKRLSLIVDKQEKIKDYLSNFSEILEEADESNQTALNTTHNLTVPNHGNNSKSHNNSQNQTLVDIVDSSSSQLNDRNVSDSSNELNDNSLTKPPQQQQQSNIGINKFKITRRNEEINETQEENLNENLAQQQQQQQQQQQTMTSNKVNRTQNVTNTRMSFANNRMSSVGNSGEARFELDAQFNDESGDILDELNQNGNHSELFEATMNGGRNFVDSRRSFNTPSSHSFNTNTSILDLDKLALSESRISQFSSNDGFKLLTDDSMLDDIQILTKNSKTNVSASNSSTSNINRAKLPSRLSMVEKRQSSQTQPQFVQGQQAASFLPSPPSSSNATSVTAISDDDSSSSSASNQSITKLMNELNAMKEKEKAHLDEIRSLEEENEKFKTVAVEFESILRNLVNDKEESEAKLKNEMIELTKERDHLQEDVIGVERAFDDLHRRFEKLKTKVEEFKKNEETLQKAIETYKNQLDKEKMKYSTLKKHAEEKLELANSEIDKLRKSTGFEIQTLKAELRKAEIKISSLELSVQQKDQENFQLTNLLEDLLAKVKPS